MRKLLWLLPFLVLAHGGASLAADNAPAMMPPPAASSDYLQPGQIDLTTLLPPPPAPGSPRDKKDIQHLLDLQHHRTPAQAARALADGDVTVFRFADVLGPNFAKDKLPVLAAFFDRVRHTESAFVGPAKDYWARPRPFEADKRIHPIPQLKEGVTNKDGTFNHSYPGGHATFGASCAIILSNMVPEKRAELFARGWVFGDNREMGGVHYPTDEEAGRIDAEVLVYAMEQNPQFQSDFAAAKAELRADLGLTP